MNPPPDNQTIETKIQRKALRKKRQSMLDPFTEQLLQMETEKKTIDQMLEWLAEQKVATSSTNLSQFLINRREEAAWEEQRERLRARAKKCANVKEWFAKNPTPDLGTVIEMFKVLMMELATDATVDPELLKLADRLARTAARFAHDQNQADYRERKLLMEEAKHTGWIRCEQFKALELCLQEVKPYREVAGLFRKAFEALRALNLPTLHPNNFYDPVPKSCQKPSIVFEKFD